MSKLLGSNASFLAIILCLQVTTCVRFANTFQSSMVFQRGAPITVWGVDGEAPLTVVFMDAKGDKTTAVAVVNNGTWSATFPARTASADPATLEVTGAIASAKLVDVLIGDVILVSGQSNVGISVEYSNQFNQSAEQENLHEAGRIGKSVRLFTVPQGGNPAPMPELISSQPCKLPSAQCGDLPWARANKTNLPGFSALGWYLARQLYGILNETVPIGVVQSDVPGTPIDHWSSTQSIGKCNNGTATSGTSRLYNAMIFPFMHGNVSFASTTWYQGSAYWPFVDHLVGPFVDHLVDHFVDHL
jgi:sialate O-acetylesterase